MSLLVRSKHYTYCPYKGDCTYYNIPIGGSKSEYAVWTYEKPYEAVANIKEYLPATLPQSDKVRVARDPGVSGIDAHNPTSVLIFQACLRRHLSEMMDRIAKGPEDVKKSARAADELP